MPKADKMFNNKSTLNQRDDFFQSPNVVGNSRFHRGSHAQGLVNPAKVVIHEMDGRSVFMVFQFLAKAIGQAGESAVAHVQREVLAFNVARGNVQSFGLAGDVDFARSNANGRRIASFPHCRLVPIEFNQLREVDLGTESAFNGGDVGFVTVAGELNPLGEPFRKVVDELVSVARSAFANVEAGNQFCLGINGNPSPRVAHFFAAFEMFGDVLLFGVSETPNFINLKQFAVQIAHGFVHVIGAGRASGDKHPFNGFLGCSGQPAGATHGATLDQTVEDLRAFVSGENVHTLSFLTNCLTETNFLSNILYNKNETENQNGSSEAAKGRSEGRVNRGEIRSRRSKSSSRCCREVEARKVRMDSENLARCREIWHGLNSMAELEGIKPSALRVTVQRRRQTSPRRQCLRVAWLPLPRVTTSPVFFSWRLVMASQVPALSPHKAKTRNLRGAQPQVSRFCLCRPIMKICTRLGRLRGSNYFMSNNNHSFKEILLGFFRTWPRFRRSDRFIGNINHVSQYRVHPHVGIGWTFFLLRLSHVRKITDARLKWQRNCNVAHYRIQKPSIESQATLTLSL